MLRIVIIGCFISVFLTACVSDPCEPGPFGNGAGRSTSPECLITP